MNAFNARLRTDTLIGDGAIGTYLHQLGVPVGVSSEELNLSEPDIIRSLHLEYAVAGADLLETNTFSANRLKLNRYGLESKVAEINLAGAALAREACGVEAFVAGAVGPLGLPGQLRLAESEQTDIWTEQIAALVTGQVDVILLETFGRLEELLLALSAARQFKLPVICQLTVTDEGFTQENISIQKAFAKLGDAGADVVGINCRSGPNALLRIIESLDLGALPPISVYPNAGLPQYDDGNYRYKATPQYFADATLRFKALGVKLIGGCCGTTPEHTQAMTNALMASSAGTKTHKAIIKPKLEVIPETAPEKKNRFGESVVEQARNRHCIIVELDPPKGLSIEKYMEGAKALRDAGADAITLADNSLAMTRMSNMALGHLIQEQIGIRAIVHLACRDRNLIGTQSHLMGLHSLGIDHVLGITGDPSRFGDLPGASSVYDLTSFDLIRMIQQLNEGISFSGKVMNERSNFVVAGAFNPNVKSLPRAIRRLEKKIESGANFLMSQPVYSVEAIEQIAEATKHLDTPIFIGIMPLTNGRMADYLHNEVPGIVLPDDVLATMHGLEGEEAKIAGLEQARILLDATMKHFHGLYLITPFLRYDITAELTRYCKGKITSNSLK